VAEVTTYYLEMTSPSELRPKDAPEGFRIEECLVKQFELNRSMYRLVGGPWRWVDKLAWTDDEWRSFAEADNLRTWVAYYQDAPAGYYELQKQDGGNIEIAYLGLAPAFTGRGLGGHLLTHAIRSAWEWEGTRRVWVHTCTLDHPGALANYEARGMTVYRKTVEEKPEAGG